MECQLHGIQTGWKRQCFIPLLYMDDKIMKLLSSQTSALGTLILTDKMNLEYCLSS